MVAVFPKKSNLNLYDFHLRKMLAMTLLFAVAGFRVVLEDYFFSIPCLPYDLCLYFRA